VLTKTERRYCVTHRELLAVITFICHLHPYLLGKHFTLHMDHESLTWLRNFKEPEGQLARWLEQLQEYDFSIVHRPGRKHGKADAFSRMDISRNSHKHTPVQEKGINRAPVFCLHQPFNLAKGLLLTHYTVYFLVLWLICGSSGSGSVQWL
jgi:hypothetical protein